MPFGLDLKSVVLTVIFVLFILPMIMGKIGNRKTA